MRPSKTLQPRYAKEECKMQILRRMFTTMVPWYNENEQTKRDEKYATVCSSARKAIAEAEIVVKTKNLITHKG